MNNIKRFMILILMFSFTFCLPPLPYPWHIPYFLSKVLEPEPEQTSSNNESITGQIDTSFGSGGYTTFDIPGTSETPEALAFKNGKILQGGYCDGLPNSKFCLVQFDSNGNIDTSFGTSGYVIFDVPGSSYEYNTSLVVQTDGKILQGGECNSSVSKFCLVRYNSDGSIDTSFNNPNGYRIYDFDVFSYKYPEALILQSDGKIVQGGHCTGGSHYFCIAQYDQNGNLLYWIKPDIPGVREYAFSLAIQSDNKILQGGYCGPSGGPYQFCIRRYISSDFMGLMVDSSFGTSGYQLFDFTSSTSEESYSIAIQNDGKILQGGRCNVGSWVFCIVRFNSDGSIDSSFGTGGYVVYDIPVSTSDMANSLAIQTNGKILQGGTCQVSGTNQFCVVRYNSDGSIDTDFGTGGYLLYDIPGITNESANSLIIVENQSILIGGNCNAEFCVVRIN